MPLHRDICLFLAASQHEVRQFTWQWGMKSHCADAQLLCSHQEIAFATLEDDMRCAEDYVRYACRWLLQHCRYPSDPTPLCRHLLSQLIFETAHLGPVTTVQLVLCLRRHQTWFTTCVFDSLWLPQHLAFTAPAPDCRLPQQPLMLKHDVLQQPRSALHLVESPLQFFKTSSTFLGTRLQGRSGVCRQDGGQGRGRLAAARG